MSKLREHLTENDTLLGRMNRSLPNSEVADAIEEALEEVRWNLEVIKKTGRINKVYVMELSKIISDLRKLGDKIVDDMRTQEK